MDKNNFYRKIPKVDIIFEREYIKQFSNRIDNVFILDVVRQNLNELRKTIENSENVHDIEKAIDNIDYKINSNLNHLLENKFKRVINCTGVVVHTNLGRSVLSSEIFEDIKDKMINYTNLEYNLEIGERGSRYDLVESLLCTLTGAEAALIVNNNAAAVFLSLNTLSNDGDVLVSRGELVEIGGSFRIPDVMKMSGAKLIEVGTTNRTHKKDFENAISEGTSLLLKVHTSNYKIVGFTKNVSTEELVKIGKNNNIPVMEDLGSGMLVDYSRFGLEYEPTVIDTINKGVDILTFSGDKLLGGPQAGIILGKTEFIDRMKKNQLTRVLRVDKFVLAALESVLKIYLKEENALKQIPTVNMISQNKEIIKKRAEKLLSKLTTNENHIKYEVIDCNSKIGGGSLPEELLPSHGISIHSEYTSAASFEKKLRLSDIPIITRISDDKIVLDMRTVFDTDIDIIAESINKIVFAGEI